MAVTTKAFQNPINYGSRYTTSIIISIHHYNFSTKIHASRDQFPEIDDLSKQRHNKYLDNAIDRKQTLNYPKSAVQFDKRTSQQSKGINYNVQVALLKCKSSDDVLCIMQNNWESITHPGVYSIALKRCIKLRDWSKARQIMDLLVYSRVEPTIFEFTQFFNAMALSDINPTISDNYFRRMCSDFHIEPDLFVFSILIKGCKKHSMYKLAETYWICMQKEYKIAPTSWLYTEMISAYVKSNKYRKATRLFKQYYKKLQSEQVQCDITTFHAYLTIFAHNGDINGMQNALELIKNENIELNKLFITELMSGYIRARNPRKAIEIFTDFMSDKQSTNDAHLSGMEPMLELKCVALAHMMKDEEEIHNDHNKKLEIYQEIEGIMKKLLKRDIENRRNHGLFHAKTLLYAAIIMYYDTDPEQIVLMFEDMVRDGYIGYLQQENVVDLHLFELLQAQFILRYVIANINKCQDRDLILIVGRGKHNKYNNNKESLKQFVIKELLAYEPALQCTEDLQNIGQLRISKKELVPYIDERHDYAMKKLLSKSKDDWYWKDSRQSET